MNFFQVGFLLFLPGYQQLKGRDLTFNASHLVMCSCSTKG